MAKIFINGNVLRSALLAILAAAAGVLAITGTNGYVVASVGLVFCVYFSVLGYANYKGKWYWTGLPESRSKKTDGEDVHPRKTLWDWLALLVVPAALAGTVFLLNHLEQKRDRERADIAAKDQTLQTYLTQMSSLMLDHNLRQTLPSPKYQTLRLRAQDVRELAHILTLTAVSRLDSDRKGVVIRFLHDAQLISRRDSKVSLVSVNFDDAALGTINVQGIHLTPANLNTANLAGAYFQHAHFRDAILQGVDFRGAHLQGADLEGTDVWGAAFQKALLCGADFRSARNLLQKGTKFDGAQYDVTRGSQNGTHWPTNFPPEQHGAKLLSPNRCGKSS